MISIIVPCYKCVATLEKCVKSVLNQTYQNIEILLVEDGSPDDTGGLCEDLSKSDKRIRVIHQENRGLVGAWKRGLLEAKGKYVCFVDSDDWIDNDILNKMNQKVEQYHVEMVICGISLEYTDGKKSFHDNTVGEGYYDRGMIERIILPQFYHNTNKMESRAVLVSRCSKLIKKSLLMQNFEMFDESISYGEDDFTIFISVLSCNALFCFRDYYPYHYCRNSESMIGKYDPYGYEKCLFLHNKLREAAAYFNYSYQEQITIHFMENCLLIMKKEMHRNEKDNLQSIARNISQIAEAHEVQQAFVKCKETIDHYSFKERIFINMLQHRCYFFCIIIVKVLNKLKIGAQ